MAVKKSFYIKLGLAVFFYILLVGLLIQLVALPIYFPAEHSGDGLLLGGDWIGYQQIALELLEKMEVEGWSAWELRPSHQAPAGIAAAIYFLTGISKPWVLLPLNAFLHACAVIVLVLIIGQVAKWPKPQVLPVLPFIFFPTALLWTSQYHKESFFILGSYLFLLGLLYLSRPPGQDYMRKMAGGFTALVGGAFLIWIVRPYGVEMVFFIGLILALFAFLLLILQVKNERRVLLNIVLLFLAFAIVYSLTGTGIHHHFVEVDYSELGMQSGVDYGLDPDEPAIGVFEIAAADETAFYLAAADEETSGELPWRRSAILPALVDENIYKMAVMRERYITMKPEAEANIDEHVSFNSAGDMLKYVPRALQIGLLAPFPETWLGEGSSRATTVMRRVNALEMLITYAALICLAAGCWMWRRNSGFYLALGFSLGMILSYSLVVANLGTLHRMRFGFIMIITALGFTLLLEIIKARREKNQLAKQYPIQQ